MSKAKLGQAGCTEMTTGSGRTQKYKFCSNRLSGWGDTWGPGRAKCRCPGRNVWVRREILFAPGHIYFPGGKDSFLRGSRFEFKDIYCLIACCDCWMVLEVNRRVHTS